MISQTLQVNVRGRPNSCCGSHEAPPPLPAPPPTQAAPHPPLWTCNNKALINKVDFPVRQDRPGSPLCSTASATASVLAPKKKKKTRVTSQVFVALISKTPFSREPPSSKKISKNPSLPPSYFSNVQAFTKRLTTIKHEPHSPAQPRADSSMSQVSCNESPCGWK